MKIPWSEEAEKGLSRAISAEIMPIISREVITGRSTLWRCTSERNAAFCVTRIDHSPDELVLVAFEGTGAKEFAPFFFDRAHSAGIPVRVHIIKRSLWRLYRTLGLGLEESEIILRSFPNVRR